MSAHLPVAHEALHVLDSVASPSRLDTRFQLHVQAAPSACCTCFHSYSPCTPTWASALLTPTPAVGAGGAASITPIWASAPLTPMPPVGAGGVALHHPHLGLSSSDTDARCRGLGGAASISLSPVSLPVSAPGLELRKDEGLGLPCGAVALAPCLDQSTFTD